MYTFMGYKFFDIVRTNGEVSFEGIYIHWIYIHWLRDFLNLFLQAAELCKRRILAVDLPTIPDHFTESDRTLYMSSLVPFENIHMVRVSFFISSISSSSR